MDHDLTWLHLSDIHFHPHTAWRDNTSRDALIRYLQADSSLKPDLIFCTGDIAFGETSNAPLAEQYQQARLFFEQLLAIWRLPKERLFVVPGNHDINRKAVNEDAQDTLKRWAEQAADHADKINQRFAERPKPFQDALTRLAEYAAFIKDCLPHQADPDGRHCYARLVEIDGLKVGVAGFNSAWSCADDQDDRHLWMAAEWQFNAAKRALQDADLRIGLVHHPLDWLNMAERGVVTHRIAADFDFWLHGHTHDPWVEPGQGHTVIGAGAVGAQADEEFGINWVRLDLAAGTGVVYLHAYTRRGGGWAGKTVPNHAPDAKWPLQLPEKLRKQPAVPPISPGTPPPNLPPKREPGLYGRAALLKDAATKLKQQPVLCVYGLRGNGKSALIAELGRQAPLADKECKRHTVNAHTSAEELFAQFASLLGESAESPRAPAGTAAAIEAEIRRRYPRPRPVWVWLEQAHLLMQGADFKRPDVGNLLRGLQRALGRQWLWVFELREKPAAGVGGMAAAQCEVPGLDKASLADCLADADPAWRYSGGELKRIYQWLGGGHGGQAHTQTTQLLIEVARGHGETPVQVLERHLDTLGEKLEESLLGDLFGNVLNEAEQRLLQALALYRTAIPHDHADRLEARLNLPGGWDGLDRRCLLTESADHARYYLHHFIAAWLRAKLGYAGQGEDPEAAFDQAADEARRTAARALHRTIAGCWLHDLGRNPRLTPLNMERAAEAFHHLAAADAAEQVGDIAVDLLTGNREWALRRIEGLTDCLFRSHAPLAELRKALEYWVALDPENPKALRFLGECWAKEEGRASAKALRCFEKACRFSPGFPHNWANLGKTLLAQGEAGARAFVERVRAVEQAHPQAINEHVRAVQADCLKRIGKLAEAEQLRQERIAAGSGHAAFYNDAAKAKLDADDAEGALAVLDKAQRNHAADGYSDSLRAQALDLAGRPEEAAALRHEKLKAGNRNPAFYNDEAKARLAAQDPAGALAVLDEARRNHATDDYSDSLRAQALDLAGRPEEAAALRRQKIDAGSRNPVFYNAEAQARLRAGDAEGALAVLELAERRHATNELTKTLHAGILRRLGRV